MPKILQRDPAWLANSTPGYNLFQVGSTPHVAQAARLATETAFDAPSRKIAHRGSEVFVVVGNEVRWSDLGLLRDVGEERRSKVAVDEKLAEGEKFYRVLKTPASRQITQLSVSPSGNYLAVVTAKTCHVCIIPSSSELSKQDTTPLKPRTFQVGPTAHVVEQAPLVSALWHPLSPSGDCLVTVTHDACVRLWELDSNNRASFNEPSLAVDLKKLANATSTTSDFSTSKYGTNRGFSPDDVEMAVAAACFGGKGREDEDGWAGMTLWIAMTEGDVYALCPFLPSKWRAPASLLPSLSTSVLGKSAAIARDADATDGEKRRVEQQYKWLTEVDAQEPLLLEGEDEFDTVEIYSRPKQLSAIPKLQGPFTISPTPDFGEITDIYVIPPKIDDEALYDDAEDPDAEEGLSVGIICLATSTNEVHVCLSLGGSVEAEWLPSKRSRAYTFDDVEDENELVLFETIDLAGSEDEDDGCPAFTASPNDRYELFVTHPGGVCALSFRPWVSGLEDEIGSAEDSGAGFRINVLLDSSRTSVDQVVELAGGVERDIDASIAVLDPVLGYVVLTSAQNIPYATVLDIESHHTNHAYAPDTQIAGLLPAPDLRAPYRPSPDFEQPSQQLLAFIKSATAGSGPSTSKSQIRFSPATLQLMTEAHRIISTETHRLGVAAADLFRRCERMRAELREQVRKVAEVAHKVDYVTGFDEDGEGEDGEEEGKLSGKERLEERIELSSQKTAELNERVEKLRRKMGRLGSGSSKLSVKEKAFADEVAKIEFKIMSVDAAGGEALEDDESPPPKPKAGDFTKRYESVQRLQDDLVAQAGKAAEERQATPGAEPKMAKEGRSSVGPGAGSEFRKQKLGQVMEMLERETALIEGVMGRLKRLQGAPP